MAELGDRLKTARAARGLSQSELARRSGISRQALGAIESGVYAPGVSVAIALARELGATVESLFGSGGPEHIQAALPGPPLPGSAAHRARVVLGRVGGRVIAVPQAPAAFGLAPSGGIIERISGRRAEVEAFLSPGEIDSTVLVAGCDPAVSILGDWLARKRSAARIVAIRCSSRRALEALAERRAHAAGVHLRDAKSGEYNLAAARGALGRRPAMLVNFARWELGLATAAANPLGIRDFADLARRRVRLVNREAGSGARHALDDAIGALGLKGGAITGYGREVAGHLEVAADIAAGNADVGVTIRVAADAYGLGFIPIREERYDLAIPEQESGLEPVRAMLEALSSAAFAREVAELCAYDTRDMGKIVARIS
ncbi:MAG TPA: substrate-binding domain-containing protein [Candidatus Binataceae bacterium]|nr:substrate-binding domain-containing protein [Candidatus Binataceae bacterium]